MVSAASKLFFFKVHPKYFKVCMVADDNVGPTDFFVNTFLREEISNLEKINLFYL